MSIRLSVVSGVPLLLVPWSSEVPPILEERWAVAQDRGTSHKNSPCHLVGITGAHWQLIPSVFPYTQVEITFESRANGKTWSTAARKDSALAPISH